MQFRDDHDAWRACPAFVASVFSTSRSLFQCTADPSEGVKAISRLLASTVPEVPCLLHRSHCSAASRHCSFYSHTSTSTSPGSSHPFQPPNVDRVRCMNQYVRHDGLIHRHLHNLSSNTSNIAQSCPPPPALCSPQLHCSHGRPRELLAPRIAPSILASTKSLVNLFTASSESHVLMILFSMSLACAMYSNAPCTIHRPSQGSPPPKHAGSSFPRRHLVRELPIWKRKMNRVLWDIPLFCLGQHSDQSPCTAPVHPHTHTVRRPPAHGPSPPLRIAASGPRAASPTRATAMTNVATLATSYSASIVLP